ncbi:hypothetical protein LCGC14_0933850 [marine sediment metagenome]|uniref:Uncharacterized protein n=1 Tax=marine sediment metagenome TaxID=412755 RepID=A0A0F9P876_9ZZZZ
MDINAPKGQVTKQVTISNTAVLLTALPSTPFTAAQVLAAARAVITVRTSQINVRYDGISPTVAIGHLYLIGDVFEILSNRNIERLEFIRNGATDADITVTLEG